MKLAVLGGVAVICATTALVVAQNQAAPTNPTQTVIGCVRGEGTAQSPWVLAGVVIPPPPVIPAGGGGGGGRGGGRGGPGGGGRGGPGAGAPGGAGAGAPGAAAAGGPPAGGPPGGGQRAAGPPPAPPAPPPPPIDLRITGLDMSPWRGGRAQVEGTMGAPGAMREFKANTARSVYGTCPNN